MIIFLLGNLITDAIIDFHASFEHPNNTWAPAAIAIWNGGGIRASVPIGKTALSNSNAYPFNPFKINGLFYKV